MKKKILIFAQTLSLAALLSASVDAFAGQQPNTPAPQPSATQTAQTQTAPSAAAGMAQRITVQDALALARKNEPTYHSAVTAAGIAREDRAQSRDALLPNVNFNTSLLYTQPNSFGGVRYIANNAPREYVSQGNVHEQLDVATFAAYRRAAAQAAIAKAQAEIASRGLVVTVTQSYFAVAAAEQKLEAARRTAERRR